MKKTFILFLSILILSCNKKENTYDKNSFITIIFKNPQINDTTFFGKNNYSLDDNKVYYRFENDFINNKININNTSKTFKIKTTKPIYLYHKYFIKDFCINSYYFYPNDTIIFEYKNSAPFVKSSKNYNYNFNTAFNLKHPLDFNDLIFFEKHKRFKNFKELENDSNERNKRDLKQIIFFDSLYNKELLDEKNYELSLSYLKNKESILSLAPIDILKQSYDLGNETYTYIVNNAFEEIFRPKFIDISDGRMTDFKDQFRKAVNLKEINTDNREYLMFHSLENIAIKGSKEEFLSCYFTYKTESKNSYAIRYFKTKFPKLFKSTIVNKNDDILINGENNKKTLTQIIESCKGKVIYIDFWASWCAPCRVLMPSSKILYEEYKNKNIEFIYISIDSDLKKWSIASKKENLISLKNNFLSLNYPKANIYQDLTMKTIPRFIIYDKKGKLVNSNAPKPDSKAIRDELDKYLNQKIPALR
ncbi:TlpA family protein disulfide reductase [Flavobacterium succinicans]|nr:TlpA disulfide reductase family protein [Flavobacterium succinicans]